MKVTTYRSTNTLKWPYQSAAGTDWSHTLFISDHWAICSIHSRYRLDSLWTKKDNFFYINCWLHNAVLHFKQYFLQITGSKWLSVSFQTVLLNYDFILPWWKSLSDWSFTQAFSVLWKGMSWIYYRKSCIIHNICVYSNEYSWWNYKAGRRVGI